MAVEIKPLSLGRIDHGRSLRDEEFAEANYEEPWRYELEDGRLVVMAPDSQEHDDISEAWRDRLGAFKLANPGLVERVVSEAWVVVGPGRQRIGDIGVYLAGERSGIRRPARAPELMFEVVSPSKADRDRDYVRKRADYHQVAILEYVIIDPKRRRVTVLEHGPDGYTERVFDPADTYATPLLPGLAIHLADVL